MTRPPIIGGRLWQSVVDRECGTCGCAGECGRRHKETGGRCTRHDGLIVAPRDLATTLAVAVGLDPAALTTWCERCHAPAAAAARKAAAVLRAARSETTALF
ncbi:hypothetical protein [Embleya hyalina]|uniref:HNH endonuclease n=1 Tax=Embleya hyalina TaxID=516124 RepID=A0A401YRA4_9ACTN|nr:hypothetical protein [Embleya hyalina]GCD97122.1 hypothetical protein EHYA_04810 [Embleya hyalina]